MLNLKTSRNTLPPSLFARVHGHGAKYVGKKYPIRLQRRQLFKAHSCVSPHPWNSCAVLASPTEPPSRGPLSLESAEHDYNAQAAPSRCCSAVALVPRLRLLRPSEWHQRRADTRNGRWGGTDVRPAWAAGRPTGGAERPASERDYRRSGRDQIAGRELPTVRTGCFLGPGSKQGGMAGRQGRTTGGRGEVAGGQGGMELPRVGDEVGRDGRPGE